MTSNIINKINKWSKTISKSENENDSGTIKRGFVNKNTTKMINEIKQYLATETSPIPIEEEYTLIEQFKDNPDELRNQLILHNIRLVFLLAKKYVYSTNDFDELVARGMYGLVIASKNFDCNRKTKFSVYASSWIRKYILCEFGDKYSLANAIRLDTTPKPNQENASIEIEYLSHNIYEGSTHPIQINPDYSIGSTSNTAGTIHEIFENERFALARDIDGIVNRMDFNETEMIVYKRLILDDEPVQRVSADINLSCYNTRKLRKSVISRIKDELRKHFSIPELANIYTAHQ